MPKMNRKLTETEIRNAKPRDVDYKLYDDGGLRLLVRKSGTKVWQYPYKSNGKWNTATIGTTDEITTAHARRRRDEIRALVKQGIDPNEQKKEAVAQAETENANSLAIIGREWIEKKSWAIKHAANIERSLKADIFDKIGHKPVGAITRQEMLSVLQAIEARGALDVAKRTAQHCAAIFDYALVKGLCDSNPATGLSRFIKTRRVQHRPYVSEKELPEFLAKLERYRGDELVKLAMQLLMLTMLRPGELRQGRWDEIDTKKNEWRIPAERMKMKREHLVPLSTQAQAILAKIHTVSGDGALLFPGRLSYKRPITDATLSKCMLILGYRGTATPHGMRATASTILNEGNFNKDAIERQLAHIEENKIRGAYNRAEYLDERRRMMQWWGDYLEQTGMNCGKE